MKVYAMKKHSLTLLGMVFLTVSFPVKGQEKNAAAPSGSHTEKPAAQAAKAASETEYKIGPQDVLRIDVWKEPDISRVIPVRPDGKISLPLLNDVQAAGLTAMQLAASLREGFSKYLT